MPIGRIGHLVGQEVRIFAAVVPPAEIGMALTDRLSPLDIPGRLTPPEKRHLTLRFVGAADDVDLDRWMAALDSNPLGEAFRLGLGAIGAFPRAGKATVLWVGVAAGAAPLIELAERVEECAVMAGLGTEDRPFRPHLTLSRIRPPRDVRPLTGAVLDDLAWRVDEIGLFRSHLDGGGARYEMLETFPLVA